MRRRLSGFARNEDGSILPFSMMVLFLMILIGGLAIDVMRHEEKRVAIQQTLDNSVLAAAALKQELDPQFVVEDYFDKVGMSEYLTGVNVNNALNARSVLAEAAADTQPFFMRMLGVNEFNVIANSGAEESISNVEISLVLDISGSMNGSRINNLRPAAKSFVDTILNNSEPGRVSMSVVPYSAQVNLGPDLMAQFNVTRIQDKTSCVELPDSVFNSISLSRSQSFAHNGHFDPFYGTDAMTTETNCSYYSAWDSNATAKTSNYVLPISGDRTALRAKIDALKVGGNTSIDLGVKWGSLLLDPNARPVTTGLIARGVVNGQFSSRPANFNASDTLKILVVMTDGENTTEYKLKEPYRTGLSHVWRNSSGTTAAYFDRSSTNKDYYWPSTGSWSSAPPTGSVRQTWPQVFEKYSAQYVAYQFYQRPTGVSYGTKYYEMVEAVSSTKNTRLQQVCNAAKSAGIVIYGIAFEAPTNGQNQIRACATSDAHYFDAQGLEIATVFQSIASQISYLRLTQ